MKYLLLLILAVSINTSWALDNPDAPDYVAEFGARILPLENYVHEHASTTDDYVKGYSELHDALDKELNIAYKALMDKLPAASKAKLSASQKEWIKFRDAEFEFLSENFSRSNFGSSYVISAGQYRTSIVKTRVIELLWYLANY